MQCELKQYSPSLQLSAIYLTQNTVIAHSKELKVLENVIIHQSI